MYKLVAFGFLALLVIDSLNASLVRAKSNNSGFPSLQNTESQGDSNIVIPAASGNGMDELSRGVSPSCTENCTRSFVYKPVCGSDGVSYSNPGELACAQACGTNVTQVSNGRCPKN